jgi:hypothetical protein
MTILPEMIMKARDRRAAKNTNHLEAFGPGEAEP